MSEANASSSEDTAEEYSLPGSYHEKYGLVQKQMGLYGRTSISWSGSAYELIRDNLEPKFESAEPRGVALKCFVRIETGVRIDTFPEAKALWGEITDELHRRRINQRQRNSLHRVRDELEAAFEEIEDDLRESARSHYNGHQFRANGEIPWPSYAQDDIRLDAPVEHQDFVRGRVEYHAGPGHSAPRTIHGKWTKDQRAAEIEKTVAELPVMFGYDD